jgi:4-alpha-glucanotransferase
MAPGQRISLALVMHNHQPVGNFGWVIEDVYRQAYEPMVAALERHPRVHVGLHYTGPLLEWLADNQPGFIDRLRALVDRGQVEILGGAHFEPILVALPERDRLGQLTRMRETLDELFGHRPQGAWLAERVWEPSLAGDLAAAGYRYTVLDDNHLRGATVAEDEMWGTYTTDDRGRLLTVFGTEKGLRYRIPWRPVEELIEYLRRNATADGRRLGTMGDDGEKFGAWPGTHALSWGTAGRRGWIDECFGALEANAEWLATVTPAGWMEREPPRGRIYVPTASYVEMTEWALPPTEATQFHRLLAEAERTESPAARFLKGAMWRNFQARYREINDLHKQMLRASAAVEAMPDGPGRERARDHLYRGQSNDCYWHGLFGGIYIVHMRMATLHHLIAAEDLAWSEQAGHGGVADYDLDGIDEVLLATAGQYVLIDVAEGGGIASWDLRASRVALASVLRRRPEAYHAQLREMEAARAAGRPGDGKTATSAGDDLLSKEDGLTRYLVYDDHERRSGLVRLLHGGREVGDFVNGAWRIESTSGASAALARSEGGMTLRKRLLLGGGRLDASLRCDVEVEAEADGAGFEGSIQLEWNVNLMGGGSNPQAYYRWPGSEGRHDAAGSLVASRGDLLMGNSYEGVEIAVSASPAADREWAPVETVSNSEAGFERVYQGSCLLHRWPVRLAPGQRCLVSLEFRVSQSRDRSREEAGEAT